MADRIIFTIDGVQYESIREFLKQHNINMHTFQMAMKQFDSEPELKHVKTAHYLLNKKLSEQNKEAVVVWNYEFESLKAVAAYFNVSLNSLYKRMCDLTLNAEQAIELLLGQSKEEWEAEQKVKNLQSQLLSKGFCSMPKNVSM